jgi:16S rRNA (guanine(966)-N(2))-methyltransferase RsmD
MRIITGLFKGRTIKTVNDLSVRPATDRVRQAIFNMLENRIELEGATVLDLFAGSGSLGLEAISRGAAHVTFVESGRDAADILEENLELLGSEQGEVAREDAVAFISADSGSYTLVFADPPYVFERTADLPSLIFGRHLVRPGGYLLIEHARGLSFPTGGQWVIRSEKHFGRTVVTFFQGVAQ